MPPARNAAIQPPGGLPAILDTIGGVGYFFSQLEPYPEWWMDRPFEATATAFHIWNVGANSRPRPSGVKIRRGSLRPLLILHKKRFFLANVMSTRLTTDQIERYSRQIMVPDIGGKGQIHLRQARVLVIGAGGLGSPAAFYLAAAGVGTLGIVDPDRVELSNLQRQILHATADIGRHKVESAKTKLNDLNPDVEIDIFAVRFEEDNAAEIAAGFDFIVDGSDNFDTKFLV